MMKKLYLSLLAISIAFASGASAQVAVAPQHAPSAYWLVPISQAQAPPVVPWHAPPVAPEANGTLPYWWRVTSTTQEDNLDRLVASATTLGEIRALLSNAARLELIRRDPLLTAFIRERIAAPSLDASSGLNTAYRVWLAETLLGYGDRIGPTDHIPSFALLPAVSAPSWPAIWRRSFAPYLGMTSGFAVTRALSGHSHGSHGAHVHLRARAAANATILARLPEGEQVQILATHGGWTQVRTRGGLVGHITSAELTGLTEPALAPYRGAESIIHWQRTEKPDGHYSAYGWVQSPWTQERESRGGH
jgi:hypothetical protein